MCRRNIAGLGEVLFHGILRGGDNKGRDYGDVPVLGGEVLDCQVRVLCVGDILKTLYSLPRVLLWFRIFLFHFANWRDIAEPDIFAIYSR